MLARAHPPRDRLANRPLSNDDNVVTHNDALYIICWTSKPTTGLLQRTRPYQRSPARQHRLTGHLSSRSSAAPCSARYPYTGRLADKVHIHGRNRSRGPGLGLAQLGACRNRDPRCLRLGWAAVWGFFNGSLPPALHLLLAARHQRRPGMNVVDRQARRSGTRRCRGWCSRENCYAYRRACLGSDVDLVVLTDQPGRYGPWGRPTGRSLQASSSLPAVAPILRRRVIVQNGVLNQDTLSSIH
jgi:hypothetical protein